VDVELHRVLVGRPPRRLDELGARADVESVRLQGQAAVADGQDAVGHLGVGSWLGVEEGVERGFGLVVRRVCRSGEGRGAASLSSAHSCC